MNGQKNDNQFEKMVRHRIEKELCQTTNLRNSQSFLSIKKFKKYEHYNKMKLKSN